MKNFLTLITATALALLSMIPTQSFGSHAVAADITYLYVGPNQYLLTMRYYNDCFGINAPNSVNIQYTSSSWPNGSITLQQLPGTGQEIPPSPCLPPVVSTCNGGTGYGVREYIYQGLVTLPGPAVDWRFSYSLCCRNAAITTVINADFYNLFLSTTMDNLNYPTNSSPTFSTIPVTQFCLGNSFYYSQLASDIDGDSLVFAFAPSESALNTPLPYAPGITFQEPLSSSTPFNIDPQTGTINFTPSALEVGVMAVIVEEYRNGVLIGTIKRDMQMNVVNTCIISVPTYAPPVDPQGNPAPFYTVSCGTTSFYIVLNQQIQCGSIVPTDIRVYTPQGTLNPVVSAVPVNCTNGLTDSILVTVFQPLDLGITWVVTKEGFDNNTFLSECGSEMAEFDSVAFNVIDPGVFDIEQLNVGCSFDQVTVTFNYEVVCNTITSTGSEFYLIDANNIIYPVTGATCSSPNGFTNTLTFNFGQFISPATPVLLMVQNGSDQNTFTNRCNFFIGDGDTLAILDVQTTLIVNLGNDITQCDTDPLPVLDAGISGATYTWFLNGIQLPDQTQTITASQTGTYSVIVSAAGNCTGNDAVLITINLTPVVVLGNDISLCATDPIPLLNAGVSGGSYQWYNNGILISGANSQTYQPTGAGIFSVNVNVGGACIGTDEIEIIIEPNLTISLGPDQTICSNDPFPILDAGVPSGTYEWFLDGVTTGITTQTIQTSAPGIYSVQVTSVSGCTGNGDITLTIIPAPIVSLGADTTICFSDVLILDAGNSGSTYQWFLNGSAISGATSQNYQPTASGNYTVEVNTGGQCLATGTINVTVVQQLSVIVADVAICSDQPYPVLDAGISGVSYSWTLNGVEVGTSQTYQPTQPGSYIVTVSIGGCSADDIFTVGVVDIPVITLTDVSVCPGTSFPVLDAGNPGLIYQWSSGETSQTITPTTPGVYTVTVTNGSLGLSCSSTSSATLSFNDPVVVSLGNDITACEGAGSFTIDAGNPGATYVWSLDGNTLSGQTTQSINVSDAGAYSVIVTDANGCTGTDNVTLTFNLIPNVNLGDDLTFCQLDELPILDATNNDVVTYSWTYNGSVVGNAPTLQPTDFGTYIVTFTDINGCENSEELLISEKPCDIVIPNIITPGNGDGKNDVFFIKNLDSNPNSQLTILNRWGREVYSSSNYQNNWDGGDLPDGTYFYVLVLQGGKDYKGTLKILREK